MVICLERGADLHMVQLTPLPLIVSCFSKIQIGFTFLVLAHPGSPGQRAVKRVCVCVCVYYNCNWQNWQANSITLINLTCYVLHAIRDRIHYTGVVHMPAVTKVKLANYYEIN